MKGHVAPKSTAYSAKLKRRRRRDVPLRVLLHLVHRFVLLAAAIAYIWISFKAAVYATAVISGDSTPTTSEGPFESEALGEFIGETTLRESRLVLEALENDTSPRQQGMLYLEATGSSFARCDAAINEDVVHIYTDEYIRSLYAAIVRDTAYNLTFLSENEMELVVPVIDCTSQLIMDGDETIGQFNLLVRKKADIDDVYMVSVTFANQGYKAASQRSFGSAGVATLTFINDLRATQVDCHYIVSTGYPYQELDFRVYSFLGITSDGLWSLEKIPNGDPADLEKALVTGTRSGFYIGSESLQSNLFSELWEVHSNPIGAIAGVNWVSKSVMFDSWAWVHYVQVLFALELLSSLAILSMVSYRNFLSGKLWIGDAFVAVSRRGSLRALLVVVTWYINGFWTLYEFVIFDVNQFSDLSEVVIHEAIIFADLLTIYFGICGMLGKVCRERVDPLLAMISFSIGFSYRYALKSWFPALVEDMAAFYADFYNLAMPERVEGQTKISPMRFWSVHEMKNGAGALPAKYVFTVLAPMMSMFGFVLLSIAVKKVHRHFVPDPLHIQHTNTTNTTNTTAKPRNNEHDDATRAVSTRKRACSRSLRSPRARNSPTASDCSPSMTTASSLRA